MRTAGYTIVEMVLVVVIMGVIAAIGFPRIRGALDSQNVRSARAAAQTFVVKARAAAVQRGCRGTLNTPGDGRMWVTVCRAVPAVGSTVDTLGPVETLAARYNVTISPSRDSIAFDARGLKINFERVTIRFAHGSITDSLVVNELGKVVRQ